MIHHSPETASLDVMISDLSQRLGVMRGLRLKGIIYSGGTEISTTTFVEDPPSDGEKAGIELLARLIADRNRILEERYAIELRRSRG